MIAIHVVAITADSYVSVPLSTGVLPLGSSSSPFWTGLGALAFDVMIALTVTSLLRKRLGFRTWRAVHGSAYAAWPLAVAHGIATGTDSQKPWALVVTVMCIAMVTGAVVMRTRGGSAARTLEA